jgi:hypothetical protein
MADEERPADDESKDPDERADDAEAPATEQDATQPGDWESKPADEEDLRHDDSSEPLAEPLGDDADDDLAEQEAGDITAGDEGFDRPDSPESEEISDTGQRLEDHAEPLLQGSEVKTPIGGVPTLSIAGIVVFIAIFLVAFFVFWALLGGIGILIGIIVGAALGLGAMKLLADRAR